MRNQLEEGGKVHVLFAPNDHQTIVLIVANDVLRPSTISSLLSVRPPHTRSPNGRYAQQIPALLHRSQIVSVNQTTCPTRSNLYPRGNNSPSISPRQRPTYTLPAPRCTRSEPEGICPTHDTDLPFPLPPSSSFLPSFHLLTLRDTHLRHERWSTMQVHCRLRCPHGPCRHGNARQQLSMRRNVVSLLAHYTHSRSVRIIFIHQYNPQSDSKDRYKSQPRRTFSK